LGTHFERSLMTAARQLHDFELLEKRPTTLGGLPALFARFRWTSNFGLLEQTVTSVLRAPEGYNVVTSITTTATEDEVEPMRDAFTALLASFRFSDEPTPPPPAAPPSSTAPQGPTGPFVPIPGHRGDKNRS